MRHSKEQNRNPFPILRVILILALLTVSVGGVRAYLLHSDEVVSNSFVVDSHPSITVNTDYRVTISNTAYPVYLRAAVVVNWKDAEGHILATVPTGYKLTPGKDTQTGAAWVQHSDGFYYYNKAVNSEEETLPVIAPLTGIQDNYTLVADVAVQAIQAVGTTDADGKDAVFDAWGISGSQITALTP